MLRRIAGTLAGLIALALLLEALLRLLPVSSATLTDYHLDPDVLTYPPGHRWTVSTGWDLRNPQTLQANNWGFAAHRPFVPNPDAVALIGDSYVEASMLDAARRPGPELERALGGTRPVYALGSPGTALLDYAQRARLASEAFGVRDFVFLLERGDARQSLCGSGNVHSRCLDPMTLRPRTERIAAPSAWKRLLRHSALAQYVFSQLKLRPEQIWRAIWTRQVAHVPVDIPERRSAPAERDIAAEQRSRQVVDAVLAAFFEAVLPHLRGEAVFVVDGRRDGAPGTDEGAYDERAYLIESLRQRGFRVVDLEPIWQDHAARSGRSVEVGPYDRHLNSLGVALAMHAAAQELQR